MEDYDKLIELNQSGKLDDLDFLLAQEEIAIEYVTEMTACDITPNNKNAAVWLLNYEEKFLYQ